MSLINGTGIVPLMTTVNENLMFGWLGVLALVALNIILLMSFMTKTNDIKTSLAISSLMIAVFASMFLAIGLVNTVAVTVFWVIAATVTLVNIISK